MFALKLKTAPTAEPVTLAEAKARLRIDGNDRDADLLAMLIAAREYWELDTRRQFVTATWQYWLDEFPRNDGAIRPPRPPLISVVSLKYTDTDGVQQTLTPTTDYTVDTYLEPGRIVPAYDTTWPSVRDVPGAVVVEYTCGYGAPAAVPQPIKTAIMALAGHLNEFPEPVVSGTIVTKVPLHMTTMLAGYRIVEFA